jgi:hypothetical protein
MSGVDARRDLHLSAANIASEGTLVAVRDTGSGLSTDRLSRLFEPFYTTKPDGLGMGLPICRSIIEVHGGRLWATPNEPRAPYFNSLYLLAERTKPSLEVHQLSPNGTKLKCSSALHYDRYQTNCRLSHQLFARPGGRTSGALGTPCLRSASRHQSDYRCKLRGRPGRNTARSRTGRTEERSAETLD